MSLVLMYITNNPQVALIAEKYGVNRIWIDLETLGKEERQKGMNTVKSKHSVEDIKQIKPLLTSSELLVRVNPWNINSHHEIDEVIAAGADLVMLPMWKSTSEVEEFISAVNKRCKTVLLLETKQAVECLDNVLELDGIDEIHIGLNDLHLSYGMDFMFEPLSCGLIDEIAIKIANTKIPYGFGGIASLGSGDLPAEKIIMEHYRLGSSRAILSRSFCNTDIISKIEDVEAVFCANMQALRKYELRVENMSTADFEINRIEVKNAVNKIIENKRNQCR